MTELDRLEAVVADLGVRWDVVVAGDAGRADVCGETSKQAWVIRRQNDQDFWCRLQAVMPRLWRALMNRRVRLVVPARRFARRKRLASVRLPLRSTRRRAAVAGLV